MALENWTEFVCIWASNSSPITSTSIIEDSWTFTNLETSQFQLLFFNRSEFDLFYFANCYDVLVDPWMVMILVKKSSEMMLYPWSYVQLKFWCWFWFSSIWLCYGVLMQSNHGSLMCVAWWTDWYSCFSFLEHFVKIWKIQMKIFMIFMSFMRFQNG